MKNKKTVALVLSGIFVAAFIYAAHTTSLFGIDKRSV
jgi:hypothetical protein